MISPKDIAEVKFTQTRLRAGYDQGEVDRFLDVVALAFQELGAELSAAQGRAIELAVADPPKTGEQLDRIINILEEMAGRKNV